MEVLLVEEEFEEFILMKHDLQIVMAILLSLIVIAIMVISSICRSFHVVKNYI